LDGYFDPNDRRYYITPESVELAIGEEKAKAAKINNSSEPVGRVRNDSERVDDASNLAGDRVQELERENLDLKIANRGRDFSLDNCKTSAMTFSNNCWTPIGVWANWKPGCKLRGQRIIHPKTQNTSRDHQNTIRLLLV
jgi:hypothetical protein